MKKYVSFDSLAVVIQKNNVMRSAVTKRYCTPGPYSPESSPEVDNKLGWCECYSNLVWCESRKT